MAAVAVVVAAAAGYFAARYSGPYAPKLADDVRVSMNQSLSSDEHDRAIGLHVKALTMLHAAGNLFEGDATVATDRGPDHEVPVHVTYDADTMLWRTDPGAFMFAVQEQMQGAGG